MAAAVVAAFAVKKAVDNKQLSAEEALEITKRTFSAKGRVQGAWISATPEAYAYESRDYQSYKGGISVLEGDDEKRINSQLMPKLALYSNTLNQKTVLRSTKYGLFSTFI